MGANGGMLSKYSAGVYSTTPVPWRPGHSAALQARLDAGPVAPQSPHADGWATVESYTVVHARDGARAASWSAARRRWRQVRRPRPGRR